MTWSAPLHLSPAHSAQVEALPRQQVPAGTVLFRPGDPAQGFVVVLEGRIEVFLTGASGREILLYAVEPGQSCIQTTLGLIGDEAYSGEAVTATPARVVLIPKPLFLSLMDDDAGFRAFVLQAFGQRMQEITRLLERVAFGRIEARLAAARSACHAGGTGGPHRFSPRGGDAAAGGDGPRGAGGDRTRRGAAA
jgi:CRP/FNR family transcriptional regulator, anaerobic regulatory protein